MIRPFKLLRIIIWCALTYFTLILLWCFLPFFSAEHDGDNGTDYPTAVLHAGKSLTRVYDTSHSSFRFRANTRTAFALDYRLVDLNSSYPALLISGAAKPVPIISQRMSSNVQGVNVSLDEKERYFNATARIGDVDGANLPWFEFADAILLFWWIQKEDVDIPLVAHWNVELESGMNTLNLKIAGNYGEENIISIQMHGTDSATLTTLLPAKPISSSPSLTYPIRATIIRFIAPTAVFANNYFGKAISFIFRALLNTTWIILLVALNIFLVAGFVLSFWRCVGGPSFEDTVQGIQTRLDRWKQYEKLRILHLDAIQDRLDQLYHSERMKAFIFMCRYGWHPERDRERESVAQEEEDADVEKGVLAGKT